MALQYSTDLRNNQLNQIESTLGASPKLQIWSGTIPANCGSADASDGTLLAELLLPSDWMADAASGSKSKSGTWEDTSANATGTATHFRLKNNAGSTCHLQGTISITAGSGDMKLDNTSIASGQAVTVTSFTISAGNA